MDFNFDGYTDLIAEGYAGLTYVLYGNNDGSFNEPVILQDKSGTDIRLDVYYDFETNKYIGQKIEGGDKGDFVKAFDWDNDGDLDLLISGAKGIHLRINEGSKTNPVYGTLNIKVLSAHYANAIVDWDGDGLWDILGGSKKGGVYFYKNNGKPGQPVFGEAECLLEAEEFVDKTTGGLSKLSLVAVSDYDNDGKLDLLIGNQNRVNKPSPKLTDDQIIERDTLQIKVKELRPKVGVFSIKYLKKYKDGQWMEKGMKEDKEYEKIMGLYQEAYQRLKKLVPGAVSHGYVFVSLRK